jgi:RNA methyltransferase, TrmH family
MHEKYPLVSNPRDPRFLTLLALKTYRDRSRSGNYLIEGIRHLARAVEHNSPILQVITEPSVLSNPFGQKLVRRLKRSGVPALRLSPELYRELTMANEPQGVCAVLRQQITAIGDLKPPRNSLWLAVESVDLPGNLGTMLRTAEAAGVAGVFLLDHSSEQCSDPWDPACVRASMGSIFGLRLVPCAMAEFITWARLHRLAIVGSSPSGLMDFKALRCRWPAVLLVGSERVGLSPQLMEQSDLMVRIPMHGRCDSVNAAVAAGVLLFEMSSQREISRRG